MALQVLASRTKIYIILEFVTGGELFDKIVRLSFIFPIPKTDDTIEDFLLTKNDGNNEYEA